MWHPLVCISPLVYLAPSRGCSPYHPHHVRDRGNHYDGLVLAKCLPPCYRVVAEPVGYAYNNAGGQIRIVHFGIVTNVTSLLCQY